MVSTGLHGPYQLTANEINRVVTGLGAGAYALGYVTTKNVFVVERVGRSDSDLNARIHDYVPECKYQEFKYGFLNTPKLAYEKECYLWHDFRPKNNPYHPDKPNGTNYPCPLSDCDK